MHLTECGFVAFLPFLYNDPSFISRLIHKLMTQWKLWLIRWLKFGHSQVCSVSSKSLEEERQGGLVCTGTKSLQHSNFAAVINWQQGDKFFIWKWLWSWCVYVWLCVFLYWQGDSHIPRCEFIIRALSSFKTRNVIFIVVVLLVLLLWLASRPDGIKGPEARLVCTYVSGFLVVYVFCVVLGCHSL